MRGSAPALAALLIAVAAVMVAWGPSPVAAELCSPDPETDECNWAEYAKELVVKMAVYIIAAVLMPIMCCCFLPMRFCCDLCGGRKAGRGLCTSDDKNFVAYSKTNVRVVSAVLFLTLVLSFVFLVLCYTANGNVGDGLNTFVNETVFIGVQLVDRVEQLQADLASLPQTRDLAATLDSVVESGQRVLDLGTSAQVQVERFDTYRAVSINIALIVPFTFGLVGAVLAALGLCKARCSISAAMCVLFFLVFVWLVGAVFAVLGGVMTDTCVEVDAYLDGDESVLNVLFLCGEDGEFTAILDVASQGLANATSEACTVLGQLPTQMMPMCDQDSELNGFKNLTVTDPANNATLTIVQCALTCMDANTMQLSANFVRLVDDTQAYIDLLNDDILPLLECDFLTDSILRVQDALCDQLTGSITQVAVGIIMYGFASIALAIGLILAQKRCDRSKRDRDGGGGGGRRRKAKPATPTAAGAPNSGPPQEKVDLVEASDADLTLLDAGGAGDDIPSFEYSSYDDGDDGPPAYDEVQK